MATKKTKVTEKEKEKMYLLYTQSNLTFKAIGKKMRRSPDTVSKYVHQYEFARGVLNSLRKF